MEEFLNSLNDHIYRKSVDVVVDVTGFAPGHVAAVRAYVDSLPASVQGKIVRIGF